MVLLSKVVFDFKSKSSAFGDIFSSNIKALKLPEGQNFQTYCKVIFTFNITIHYLSTLYLETGSNFQRRKQQKQWY